MNRLTTATISITLCASGLAACGSSAAHGAPAASPPTTSPPAAVATASAAVPSACRRVAQGELVTVAHRVYAQAVAGRNEAHAASRLRSSTALAAAVASRDPHAVTAALAPLLKHQITRVEVSAGGRTLARIGSTAAYAPVNGSVRFQGRQVGTYVFSVSSQGAYSGIVGGLTGARVHFGAHPVPGATSTFPARTFPHGRTTVSLTLSGVPSSVCAPTAAATRLSTIGLVGRNLLRSEVHGAGALRAVRHAEHDPAFRAAVIARNPAAVRAAIVGFFDDKRFHIVRVRAWDGAHVINDVGGPYVVSPAVGTIRTAGGRVAGRFMLSVQDDTGYIKLMHRFTGAVVVLHTATGKTVPGSNWTPGPPFEAGLSSARYAGRTHRSFGLVGSAFPSGPLRVSLLDG